MKTIRAIPHIKDLPTRKQLKRFAFITAAFFCLISLNEQAHALPFRPNAAAFTKWMNLQERNYGHTGSEAASRAYFHSFYNCKLKKINIRQNADKETASFLRRAQANASEAWIAEALESRAREAERGTITKTFQDFECDGYVTLRDPRGRRICKLFIRYSEQDSAYNWWNSECVWR